MSIFLQVQNYLKKWSKERAAIAFLLGVIGFPALSFAAYAIFAGVPLGLLDYSIVANFFLGFYLSAILSVAIARVLLFLAEAANRLYVFSWVLPAERRQSRTRKKMMEAGAEVEAGPDEWTLPEFRRSLAILSRYEQALLRKRMKAKKRIKKRFASGAALFCLALLTAFIFSVLFSGARVFTIAVYLLLAFILFGYAWVNRPERELDGVIRIAVYEALTQDKYMQGIDRLPIRRPPSAQQSRSKPGFWKSIFSSFRADVEVQIGAIRKDLGLLSVLLSIMALAFGYSKFNNDLLRVVRFEWAGGRAGCVSPLLSGSRFTIAYSKESSEIVILPHDSTIYEIGRRCATDA